MTLIAALLLVAALVALLATLRVRRRIEQATEKLRRDLAICIAAEQRINATAALVKTYLAAAEELNRESKRLWSTGGQA